MQKTKNITPINILNKGERIMSKYLINIGEDLVDHDIARALQQLCSSNFVSVRVEPVESVEEKVKTLHNSDPSTAKKNVPDIIIFGHDQFKLLSKASSKKEGWMKSTKAMEIPGVGCVVQVTTQQGEAVAEAVCFVPSVRVNVELDNDSKNKQVLSRNLVADVGYGKANSSNNRLDNLTGEKT